MNPSGKKQQRQIPSIPDTGRELWLDGWKEAIGEHFPNLVPGAEVCASVIAQLTIDDVSNPFCLILIDAPASGKTMILNFFKGVEEIMEFCDDFTPSSFVSGLAGRTEEQLKKIDLLPRIQFRTLVVPEMNTIMSENEDVLRTRLGRLTRVLDGEGLEISNGVQGKRGYRGDYLHMMLGAGTPFPLRVWKAMASLGHRMFFLNLCLPQTTEEDISSMIGSDLFLKEKMEICQEHTRDFLSTIWKNRPMKWEKAHDEKDAVNAIVRFSFLQAKLRSEVIVYTEFTEDGRRISSATQARTEEPRRAAMCLYNVARGHARLCGRNSITIDDIPCVARIVLSTAPDPRSYVFRAIVEHGGTCVAREIMDALGISRNTAKRELLKLEQIGLGTIEKEMDTHFNDVGIQTTANDEEAVEKKGGMWTFYLHDDFSWIVSDEWIPRLKEYGIIQEPKKNQVSEGDTESVPF